MYYSPKTSTDGLVFHYDTGNTVRSYLGEPTVNLLYSAGAYNLIDGATDIYGRVTKTNLGGGKYRFVNNGVNSSTIRLYTNQSDLINGATYGCSVYFEDLVGSLTMDWCDTGITGVNSSTSPSGRLYGTGTRALYDGPYYFLDVNLSTGGAVTLYDPQVEYKSHVTPFVAGTRSATQGLLDLTGNSTIDLTNVSFDSNAQMTFDGTNDQIILDSYAGNIPYGTNITVEAVVKFNDFTPNDVIIAYGGNGSNNEGFLFQYEFTAGLCFLIYANPNFGEAKIGADASQQYLGQYIHMVGTYDGTAVKLYINGTLVNTGNFTYPYPQKTSFRIGNELNRSYYSNMILPVSKIYNRALTADEVQRNFNAVKSRFNIA